MLVQDLGPWGLRIELESYVCITVHMSHDYVQILQRFPSGRVSHPLQGDTFW